MRIIKGFDPKFAGFETQIEKYLQKTVPDNK